MKRILLLSLLALLWPVGLQQERATNRPPPGMEPPQTVAISGSSALLGRLVGANANATTDQAITIGMGKYVVRRIIITNASTSLTLAVGGFYTGAGKTGTTVVANTQVYSTLTASTKFLDCTLAAGPTTDVLTSGTIYLSLTTAQGGAATMDCFIYGDPLP